MLARVGVVEVAITTQYLKNLLFSWLKHQQKMVLHYSLREYTTSIEKSHLQPSALFWIVRLALTIERMADCELLLGDRNGRFAMLLKYGHNRSMFVLLSLSSTRRGTTMTTLDLGSYRAAKGAAQDVLIQQETKLLERLY